jgi:phage terminase large subunit-like protein
LKELEYQLAVDVQKLNSDKTAVNSINSYKKLGDHLEDGPDVSSKLVQDFLKDTLKSLSIQLNEIRNEMTRFDSPSFSRHKFLRYFGLRQSPAAEQSSYYYGPATRSLLATKIEKYVTEVQERLPLHPNPPFDPPPPNITKNDIVSAIGDSYKKMEKKRGSVIWEQLRREIGTRFLQDKRGFKTDIVALGIHFDDVSDIIPKELWDDRFESANTHRKEQEQTREECTETNLKLLFSRAALNKYSKYGNLVKVLACLVGNHRTFLGRKKYQSIRCRVIAESPLDQVWFFDDKPEDEYFSVILEKRNVREHTTIQTTTKMQIRNVVSEFDPEEAVSRLEVSLSYELNESVRSRLKLLLDELKYFAKLVQVSKNHSTEEATTTCNSVRRSLSW